MINYSGVINILYMGQIKILAGGDSQQARAQARGKLFETLMADVLRQLGYQIDVKPNVNYAGMEIDIEGKHIVTDIPLYAECKCYETEIDSPKLQAFYGKYMSRWHKNKHCHGMFIALPGINSHAKGFYNDYIKDNSETTVQLYEQDKVLVAIFQSHNIVGPEIISEKINADIGKPGDWLLLYTDKGFFWIQYVVPIGSGIANGISIFDANGEEILDKQTYDYLLNLYPELTDFVRIQSEKKPYTNLNGEESDEEQIVEVRGSSECFEYQFPASPEHFVGRETLLNDLDSYSTKIINKETSSRGILFEAYSGWGKSSLVLACVSKLQKMGHFAVAIDSRSASSSQFILRVTDYAINKFGDFNGMISDDNKSHTVTGFEGAVNSILKIGKELEQHNKILFIFLDQFENVFFLQDTLKRIRDLFLKICDAETNVVFGFSWKTDLVGSTMEFPYHLRDSIIGSSNRILLDTFSEYEINSLLDRLANELHVSLRKDLRFLLSEFSQGYPWLLKKLCAHVRSLRQAGVQQSDIARKLLNVEELFKEDLRGLSAEEEDALRRIAKSAPISILELGEEYKTEVVQSLVNRRLVVRIANKYDIYWDIFRDYLNTGRLPIQENYILRAQVGSVIKAIENLRVANVLDIATFQKKTQLSEKSFYNVAKDMGLLGLAKLKDGNATLLIKLPNIESEIKVVLREHLQDTLRRNRLVWRILKAVEEKARLNLEELSDILRDSCPYNTVQ